MASHALMETDFLTVLKPYLNKYDITYKAVPDNSSENRIAGKTPMFDWVKENLPQMTIDTRLLSSIINDMRHN